MSNMASLNCVNCGDPDCPVSLDARKKRYQPYPPKGGKPVTIDLTGDDDDDVIVAKVVVPKKPSPGKGKHSRTSPKKSSQNGGAGSSRAGRRAGHIAVPAPAQGSTGAESSEADQTVKIDCPICYETIPAGSHFTTKCGHMFCKSCLLDSVRKFRSCPQCRKPLKVTDCHVVFLS
eukprot:TRINITY_DN5491_c0_g4_i2.p1 TRINITY_DN5491_c0_g4~~TRINITY_DN5491_c0_g4_i2.p1  ORF type:complete len:175 (-),score=0.62 TRINITY_DN5491_c0_g4_i2:172-696(-)